MNKHTSLFSIKQVPYSPKFFLPVLAIALFFLNVLIYQDSTLYQTSIAKVIAVDTTTDGTVSGDLEIEETQYSQNLTCRIQNGTYQGKIILLTNTYSETRMDSTRYHVGNFLFIKDVTSGENGILSGKITSLKRDYYISILLSLIIFGAILTAGKRGFSFLLALLVNIFLVFLGFFCYQTGIPFLLITLLLLVLFTIITLTLCIGHNREAFIAGISTYICMAILTGIYCLAMFLTPKLDYTLQDYIRNGNINLDIFFTCGTLIGCLGAIMDVSVSITSSVAEILVQTPDISTKELSISVRQIGLDVMGTMINVLFYTYMVGRIPVCIAQLSNGMPLTILFQYYLVYEILRFLAGAIGIALCIPVAEKIAVTYYRKKGVLQ